MSYQSISVKEAVDNINANNNGWFLTSVQRPYVWGSRYENEKYICKLFDSILRGYPIGGLILWNTDKEIKYSEFMQDYKIGAIRTSVDSGLWNRLDKWLVYDGQQRLQTLYSCLKYTLNGKVLVFNMLFDLNALLEDMDETGFVFVEKNADVSPNLLRMNKLFSKQQDEKTSFRRSCIEKCAALQLTAAQENLIEDNIDKLWDVFVKNEIKSISYFPIKYQNESRVNEIFQRLNTGGVPLSEADLLFSKIKEFDYDFEENLQYFSKEVFELTGYLFDHYSILQLINLIVKGTTRIDTSRMQKSDLKEFPDIWNKLEVPLRDFYENFIWGQFKINNNAIVPKKMALLPLIVYFYEIYCKNFKFTQLDSDNLLKLKQYFILSQINDWNLQSITDNFTRIIKEKSSVAQAIFEFPTTQFADWLNQKKLRNTDLYVNNFADYHWFSLKVLTPNREYHYEPDERGRHNPEIDHIFPRNLKDQTEEYRNNVDILWNMQPVKGEINNFKRRKHPKQFFSSQEGNKYLNEYDFIPTVDLSDPVWDNPLDFIEKRKEKMITHLKQQYDLDLK